MKKILILLIIFFSLAIKFNSALAIVETEATSAAEEKQEETTQNIKDRLKKALQDNNDKIKSSIDDLTKTRRGFIGELQRVSEETLSVKGLKSTIIIPLDEEVKIIKSGKEITADKLTIENWLTILGHIEDDSFIPKRILVSTSTLAPRDHIVELGAIVKLEGSNLTFKARSADGNQKYQLSKTIKYLDHEGEKANKTNFTEDTQSLLIGYKNKNNVIVTTLKAIVAFD
jgi:hypothetical protein